MCEGKGGDEPHQIEMTFGGRSEGEAKEARGTWQYLRIISLERIAGESDADSNDVSWAKEEGYRRGKTVQEREKENDDREE